MSTSFDDIIHKLDLFLKRLNSKSSAQPVSKLNPYDLYRGYTGTALKNYSGGFLTQLIIQEKETDPLEEAEEIIKAFQDALSNATDIDEIESAHEKTLKAFEKYRCTQKTAEEIRDKIDKIFKDKIRELILEREKYKKIASDKVLNTIANAFGNNQAGVNIQAVKRYNSLKLDNAKQIIDDLFRLLKNKGMIGDCDLSKFKYAITGAGTIDVDCPYIIWTGTKVDFIIFIRLILGLKTVEQFKPVVCIFRQDKNRSLSGRNACTIVDPVLWDRIMNNIYLLDDAASKLYDSTRDIDKDCRENAIVEFYYSICNTFPQIANLVLEHVSPNVRKSIEKRRGDFLSE